MFAVIKLTAVMVIGAVAFSMDPIIGGAFTLLNTVLITRLNQRNQERTDTVVSHLEEIGRHLTRQDHA